MYERFLEIAFEAELNTKEDPELYELAYEHCHEDLNTREASIEELRSMIYERGECLPFRMDDSFLLRFLRATKFIVPKAHRLVVRYCAFRDQYPYLYKDVDMWELVKVKDAYEGSMLDRPDVGRLSIFRFGMWDPSEFPVEDLVRAGMLMMEIGLRQPKLQVIGGTVIVDLEGITLRHVATLTPTVAYQIVGLLGLAMPCRLKACHFVNYSWIINTFIYLFKRFIPRKSWDKIHFHGYNLKSLQEHIDPECLPVRYGGTCRNVSNFGIWLTKIKKYRDSTLDQELKKVGYMVKE
ncbi:clavesin-2-like isoform X4 [Ostrinia furnacalis]|uniref:clavesin-2-like isoform X1 n=1 Tax=Ostrinia furnacalis TaxID=93504 RepID=UPI001039F0D6|nr:clavesin-2-like isoform X1 [Ostrinia furnacalis]XP_028178835.1 clavesin-2-like isoform X1 [Ostrinia furnacalis]XP_028178836.1 clavesin-2-like isoform X1 [Ostrinia furnacalis]XP_028178838.1 clavesin-2-like isoform X3 [Ostrinia furnacalis]XP_028178840.1 clavesin-2-like isoform X4 [Ostrinia furnacalis]